MDSLICRAKEDQTTIADLQKCIASFDEKLRTAIEAERAARDLAIANASEAERAARDLAIEAERAARDLAISNAITEERLKRQDAIKAFLKTTTAVSFQIKTLYETLCDTLLTQIMDAFQ